MSGKGEKYKSAKAKAQHESKEGAKERKAEYGKKAAKKPAKVQKVMHEFKTGSLHSGKGGPVVKSRKQAIAIAMSEANMSKKKKKK